MTSFYVCLLPFQEMLFMNDPKPVEPDAASVEILDDTDDTVTEEGTEDESDMGTDGFVLDEPCDVDLTLVFLRFSV